MFTFPLCFLSMGLWCFPMVEERKSKNIIKDVAFRIAKATLKAIFVYLIYFLLAPLLAPLFELIPSVMESIEAFVAIYIALMIIGDVTARTIFEHIFRTARHCSLWVTCFFHWATA